jgi:hypothetical protein
MRQADVIADKREEHPYVPMAHEAKRVARLWASSPSGVLTLCVGGCTMGLRSSVGRGAILAALTFRANRRAFLRPGCGLGWASGGHDVRRTRVVGEGKSKSM